MSGLPTGIVVRYLFSYAHNALWTHITRQRRRQYIQEVHKTPIFSKLYDVSHLYLLPVLSTNSPDPGLRSPGERDRRRSSPVPRTASQPQQRRTACSGSLLSTETAAGSVRAIRRACETDTPVAVSGWTRQLAGPCSNCHPFTGELVLAEEHVPFAGTIFLPSSSSNPTDLSASPQAIPKPTKPTPTTKASTASTPEPGAQGQGGHLVDPDSDAAHALQPLLEQEALLESFVEEAKAHRKLEDAKTLKANLAEIRAEIDRILANADAEPNGAKGKGKS